MSSYGEEWSVRVLVIVSLLGVALACGDRESSRPSPSPEQAATPAGSTDVLDKAAAAADVAAGAMGLAPEARHCLRLVDDAKWAEAVPTCRSALASSPDNAALRAAVDRAEAQLAPAAAQEAGQRLLEGSGVTPEAAGRGLLGGREPQAP